jgi:hypothetical protein
VEEKTVQVKPEVKEKATVTDTPKVVEKPKPKEKVIVKTRTPSPVSSDGSCIALKRQEIGREIEQLRRETNFKFIDLKSILADDCNA